MAIPYYYPANYQQNYYNPYQAQNNIQPQNTQQIQNGGFISVRSEDEARNYPVAPGNSVTFRNETAPYVYTKTMGFSQLDRPVFDKYRLVKEEDYKAENAPNTSGENNNIDLSKYALKADLTALREDFDGLKEQMFKSGTKPTAKTEKKRGDSDE